MGYKKDLRRRRCEVCYNKRISTPDHVDLLIMYKNYVKNCYFGTPEGSRQKMQSPDTILSFVQLALADGQRNPIMSN